MIAHPVSDPFYYLHNFQQVLDWLLLRYADLLSEQEHDFIHQFGQQPQATRAMLVRMVMRKGQLFRASKLEYAEIGPSAEALAPLVVLAWVDDDAVLSLEQLFQMLRKDEIVDCFATALTRPRAAKPELFAQLAPLYPEPRRLFEWYPGFAEVVYAWRLQALCDRLRLLFFGNLHQDWSEFVLADLGVLRYEQVAFSADSRAMRERNDVEVALALHECAEQLAAGVAVEQVLARAECLHSLNPWLERRRARLLFHLGQQCEREGNWALAQQIYPLSAHPQAPLRHIRVLERDEQWAAALNLAEAVSEQPLNALQAQALDRVLPRLRRKLGGPAQPRRSAPDVHRVDLCLPREHSTLGVERAVQQHLEEEGGQVFYVENCLFNGLFGLLCWDAIFAPLPGAFFHPFQRGPQDLHDPGFHARREALFGDCLAQLEDGRYHQTIRANHVAKRGLQSPFVVWEVLDETLLEQALACLPAEHLSACFRRLLEDIKHNRAGMPDLIQLWPEARRYRMIEVKGPGDRLQDNQLRWIAFCSEHGLPVEVCHVQWAPQAS